MIEPPRHRPNLRHAYNYSLRDGIQNHGLRLSEGSAAGNAKSSVKGLLEVMLGRKASRKAPTRRDETHQAKATRHITLISCNGEYWTVGDDEYGDPRNPRGRLRGPYFNEEKDKPLCAVDVKGGAGVATITIQVRARFGDLDIDLLDDRGRPGRTAGPEHVSDIGRALRARLAGIAAAKIIRDRQVHSFPALPPSEFVLEQKTLFVRMLQA
jgi:hypothetical protein